MAHVNILKRIKIDGRWKMVSIPRRKETDNYDWKSLPEGRYLTVAIHYALGLWTPLLRYCNDGRLEIDNNAAERALRAVALGRKNYLFAGSDVGGERAAAMYTLIGSAKLNGIDPEAYLSHVLARIADHPIHQIEELLPWNLVLPHSGQPVAD